MTSQCLEPITASHDATLEDVSPFGAADQVFAYTGFKKGKPITFGGLYSDTGTTGSDAVFVGIGTSATLEVDIGGTKKFTATAFVQTYDRIFKVGAMTRYKATLVTSGAWSET